MSLVLIIMNNTSPVVLIQLVGKRRRRRRRRRRGRRGTGYCRDGGLGKIAGVAPGCSHILMIVGWCLVGWLVR
ncbi:MAG: hypothetical protein BYD32DRAFT_418002 [Podila humilis]|nr:MAG: hypothetical protein BYD32DRAFT_418002 [Podila humilis]